MLTPSEEARLKASLQRQLADAMKENMRLDVEIAALAAQKQRAAEAFLADPDFYKRRDEKRRAAVAISGGFLNLTRPGEPEPVKVEFTFRHKTKEALNDWIARSQACKHSEDDAALLGEIIEDWSIQADDGSIVPFTAENLRLVIENFVSFTFEIVLAYITALGKSRADAAALPVPPKGGRFGQAHRRRNA